MESTQRCLTMTGAPSLERMTSSTGVVRLSSFFASDGSIVKVPVDGRTPGRRVHWTGSSPNRRSKPPSVAVAFVVAMLVRRHCASRDAARVRNRRLLLLSVLEDGDDDGGGDVDDGRTAREPLRLDVSLRFARDEHPVVPKRGER